MKIKLDSQDKRYVSRVKSRVENHNRQTFDVTDLNGQTVMLGSEGIVALALAMRETMTVAELLKMILMNHSLTICRQICRSQSIRG